jgi:hypothetical protein
MASLTVVEEEKDPYKKEKDDRRNGIEGPDRGRGRRKICYPSVEE